MSILSTLVDAVRLVADIVRASKGKAKRPVPKPITPADLGKR